MNKTKTQTPVQTSRKSSNYRTNRSETLGRSHANNRTAKTGLNDKEQTENDSKQDKPINECGIEEIDQLIKINLDVKRQYSKTYVDSHYTPLSDKEKVKFIEEMSSVSSNRMILYSELFKEIKTQMSFLSNNMSTTVIENETNKSRVRLQKNFNTSSMNHIDEENDLLDYSIDENRKMFKIKSKSILKMTPKNKTIIKIDNPDFYEVKATPLTKQTSRNHLNIDCDLYDGDEHTGLIKFPESEYRSNCLGSLAKENLLSHSFFLGRISSIGSRYDTLDKKYRTTDRKNTHVVPNRPNLITKFEYTDTQQDINGKDNKNHFNRAKMELNFLRKVNQPDEYSQSQSHLNEEDLKFSLPTQNNKQDKKDRCILF